MRFPLPAEEIVVYTDLDGTLLDHHDYSYAAARPALDELRRGGVPVVLTSSKTFPELVMLADRLGLDHPVIGENGAFVAWPRAYDIGVPGDRERDGYRIRRFGADHAGIVALLATLRADSSFRFEGFSDWDVATLAARTGLPPDDARRAGQREASEPIVWRGSEAALSAFRRALADHGLTLVKGGRFFHVMGDTSKADAMRWLHHLLEERRGRALTSIALGDGPNDLQMLEAADVAVVVANPDSDPIAPQADRILWTRLPGPAGWNEAILELLGGQR